MRRTLDSMALGGRLNLALNKPCVEWSKGRFSNNYGAWWYQGRQQLAHRVAWALAYNAGELPVDCVLHRCDNPPCVEPTHLFLGTRLDNALDKVRKHRQARGAGNAGAKLTYEQVLEIRATPFQIGFDKQFAQQFGISDRQIRRVRRWENWQ